ncbi:hypothetical protein DCO48_21510 [Pseudomonas sp. SDI]|uniref:hypothetical protein n=1 Tax=Pseudomonas sp. SDI TaxID=2170734 RepID=UPI000DE60EEA|nr:hypothetical protein [Pseudomonas sp. SDI]PWB30086.1 hypothetical protein DCO48_21510 [Pseudomonas sp. SDI]
MKQCLLVGCGAEIGANLLLLNTPEVDQFTISTVITNPPPLDKHYPHLTAIHGIVAKLALAQPAALERLTVVSPTRLCIDQRPVDFIFANPAERQLMLPGRFDLAIIATAKADILPDSPVAKAIGELAAVVVGVAEADSANSIYGCLAGLEAPQLPSLDNQVIERGLYCLGSCQTNGMHASLRVVLEALAMKARSARAVLSIQTDIVHPDTPNGVLGTRSFEGRMQDARNNLRPSFSQIVQSRRKVLPWADLLNTVSLRAAVQAPGYQINRFVVADQGLLSKQDIIAASTAVNRRHPAVVAGTDVPLGSRAFSASARCATLLLDDAHLLLQRPAHLARQGLTEIILQGYVSNTLGYSALVLRTLQAIASGQPLPVFAGV